MPIPNREPRCQDCTPYSLCEVHLDHLNWEIDRTIHHLEEVCADPTQTEEERADARVECDFLIAGREKDRCGTRQST